MEPGKNDCITTDAHNMTEKRQEQKRDNFDSLGQTILSVEPGNCCENLEMQNASGDNKRCGYQANPNNRCQLILPPNAFAP